MYNEQRVCYMLCVSVNRRKLFPALLYMVRPDIDCRTLYPTYMENDALQMNNSERCPAACSRSKRPDNACLPDKIMSLHVDHEIGPSVNGYTRHGVS